MADNGQRYTDRRQAVLHQRLQRVYRQSQKELEQKLESFVKKYEKRNQQKLQDLHAGIITEQEYKDWLSGQVFITNQWKAKVEEAAYTLLSSNEKSLTLIRDEQLNVFAENANYQAYMVETIVGAHPETNKELKLGSVNFDIYDTATVDRLIKKRPELLPRKVVNGKKDTAWNKQIIWNTITQGIIQGESIPQIAKRMAHDVASTDMKAMVRYARTAMTGAQNAGRMETMHRAQNMGIRCQKQWLATLDGRTRDSHRHLDGQIRDIDEPFDSELGKIMFPGDPDAEPGDIWNCRCTLEYVYPEYMSAPAERAAYDEYVDEDGTKHRDYFVMPKGSNYGDWLNKKKEMQSERVRKVGTISKDKFKEITKNITTDEVIITGERIEHSNAHNNAYTKYGKYIASVLSDPDYIFADKKPNTAILIKQIKTDEKFVQLILRLHTSDDREDWKNSVISYWDIGENTVKRYIRNKKMVYKR